MTRSLILRVAAIFLAAAVPAGCSAKPPSVAPSPPTSSSSSRPITPVGTPPVLPSAVPADVTLQVADAALRRPIVVDLVPTPSGFALLGYDADADGPAGRFLVSGSPDGRSWSRLTAGATGPAFTFLTAGPLGWIASSDEIVGADQLTELWFSADGKGWDRVPDQAGLSMSNLSGGERNPLSAGPTGFAIVGQTLEGGSSVTAVWVSPDGRSWTEARALHGHDVGRVIATTVGFVAYSTSCCAGVGTAFFSPDGLTWRDLSADAGAPFDPNAGGALIASVGSTLVVLRAGGDGTIEAFSADLSGVAGNAPATWRRDEAALEAFAGSGLSSLAGGSGGAVAIGFDRTSLDAVVWTSTDGRSWTRRSIVGDPFSGGVPGIVAAGSSDGVPAFVAIADRSNETGAVRPQLWRSDDGASWAAAGDDLLGALPVVATGPCPSPAPTAVDGFLAMAPSLWPACFGHARLTIRGIVEACECGGTTSEAATPSWLIDPLGLSAFYLRGPIVPAATGPGGFGVMIDPAHPVTAPNPGTEVELTGHFDDPAAATCRISPLPGAFGRVRPRAQSVALCRQAFVAEAIRIVHH